MKFIYVLTSRKFWAAILAIVAVFGVIPEGQEEPLIQAILTVVTAASYIIGTAIEDSRLPR